jgi:hypothetical protein
MPILTDNYVFRVIIFGLLAHRPMTTAELYEHAKIICPTRCNDSVHNNWEKAWTHHLRSAQQYLRRTGVIEHDSNGLWSLTQ